MQPRPKVSVVIPCHNAARTLGETLESVFAQQGTSLELIAVNDASTDGTGALLARQPGVAVVSHPKNRGYGAALRTGFSAARFPLVAFTDADCQFDLSDLATLARLAEEVPVAVGYRADRKDPWRRRFLSRGYNLMARTLLGTRVRDIDCALKVFRREALDELLPDDELPRMLSCIAELAISEMSRSRPK